MLSTNEIILAAISIMIGGALAPLAAYFLKWTRPYLYGEDGEEEPALPSEDTKIIIKKGERTTEISTSINDDQLETLIVQLQNLASQN
ncbi:MAG: hypothetical protein ACPGWR_33860 [Ardenticatenaceae bacterium]